MQWLKNNKGFLLILVFIVAFVIINFFQGSGEEIIITESQANQYHQTHIEVEIKGEIHQPGLYTCRKGDRIVDLINLAGGLTVHADIDAINRSQKLEDEMVITIPKKMNDVNDDFLPRYIFVEVKGAVQHPGIYKLPEHSIINDLIQVAGGLRADADTDAINLAQKLMDEDVIVIDEQSNQFLYVEIKGAVKVPGVYQMFEGQMIYDLIEEAGGLLSSASIDEVNLVKPLDNHEVIIIPDSLDKDYWIGIDIKGAIHSPGVYYVPIGTRVIDLVNQAGGLTSKADYESINLAEIVKDEQVILIPEVKDERLIAVDIKGQVKYPGVYYLKDQARVIDLVRLAGGFKPDADHSQVNLSEILSDQDLIIIEKITDEQSYIYVEIKGEVLLPGIYAMRPGDRLIMLVHRAGGFTDEADTSSLNLSRVLLDEEIIQISNVHSTYIYVKISGAVHEPGTYYVSDDYTILDLIFLAGGLTNQADLALIDTSQVLRDLMEVYIPYEENQPITLPGEMNGKININTANLEQLQTLTGVGIILSERIIEYREINGPFTDIEEIINVVGIGDSIYEKIKDDITV